MTTKFKMAAGLSIVLSVVAALLLGVLVPMMGSGHSVAGDTTSVSPAAGDPSRSVSSPAFHDPTAAMTAPAMPEEVPCDFGHLTGLPAATAEEAVRATNRPVRMLRPDSSATMDYSPARVNVHVTNDGVVEKITCG
jgi:hypothetical protein